MLSHDEILAALKERSIRISPLDRRSVGAVSVDLRLGNEFKIFHPDGILDVNEEAQVPGKKVRLKKGQYLELAPHQFVLGCTRERVTLSKQYAGHITGRSRYARMGLMVHVSSSLIQPGVDNVQVLEIVNLSPATLRLHPGTKICQVFFHKLRTPAEYRGKFKRQRGV